MLPAVDTTMAFEAGEIKAIKAKCSVLEASLYLTKATFLEYWYIRDTSKLLNASTKSASNTSVASNTVLILVYTAFAGR